jgi:hypothetical protein
MPLTLTAPYIQANDLPLANTLTALGSAVDEVLTARLGGMSWLAFYPNVSQLETGDEFVFGTITNLATFTAPYAPITSKEFPAAPVGGQVYSYDSASKYVTVTGTSDFGVKTLNIKHYNWKSPIESTPSKWWAKYDKCERFHRLGVADIIIEGYTDPVAGNNSTFTWKAHWDKYGCIRIHNGNRFDLTWTDGSGSNVVIPAYGVKCARRLSRSGSFQWANNYIHETIDGDETTYDAEYNGQYAACMDKLTKVVETFENYCYFNADTDSDSTTRESVSFTGTDPVVSDYVYDWVYHKGIILSVVTEITSGTSSVVELQWNGVGSGFSANNRVNQSFSFGNQLLNISTAVSNPNWIHHLIPKSTNLIGIGIVDITNTPISSYVQGVGVWNHLQSPLLHGSISTSSYSYSKPYPPYADTANKVAFNYSVTNFIGYNWEALKWDATIAGVLPEYPLPVGVIATESIKKVSSAIGVQVDYTIRDPSQYCVALDDSMCDQIRVADGTSSLDFTCATHLGLYPSRRRFLPRQVRKYHDAGRLNGSGFAVYDWHPQDFDITGSLDQDASSISLILRDIHESPLQIEGLDWITYRPMDGNQTDSPMVDVGTWLHLPENYLAYVLENINRSGWWFQHYQSLLDNTHDQTWKLLTWRIPRTIEQFNDLARCVNNIREVNPVSLEELYKDPLPAGMRTKPWAYYPDELGIAVPNNWLLGYNDVDNRFSNWCSQWGIPVSSIDVSTIMTTPRKVWRTRVDTRLWPLYANPLHFIYDFDKLDYTVVDFNSNGITETVNAYSYQRKFAVNNANQQRILFGSAGSLSRYRYADYYDVAGAFNWCNIHIGTRQLGYRYTPTIEESMTLTKTEGVYYGDIAYEADYSRIANDWTDAQLLYRLPDTSGEWMETIEDKEHFRLMDITGGDDYVIVHIQEDPSIPSPTREFLVHTMNFSTDGKKYGVFDFNGGTTKFLSYSSNKLVPIDAGGNPAWQSIPYFSADYPVTIICSAEPYYSHYYESPWPEPDDPTEYEGFTTTNPTKVPLFVKRIETTDYPVTVDKINSWSGRSLNAWHVQIIKHSGVLRE